MEAGVMAQLEIPWMVRYYLTETVDTQRGL